MPSAVLHFADCRLDVAARSLFRAGERVDLPPIVFDCIAYLATRRERAVGRDELVAAVWGKSAITDTMLGKAILAARRAVGDTAEAQALIRTVPRFGYHFVGAVRVETLDDAQAPTNPTPAASSDVRRSPKRAGWTALAVVVLGIAIAAAFAWHRARETRSVAADPRPRHALRRNRLCERAARSLAGERRIPASVATFDAPAPIAAALPNERRTAAER